MSEEFLKNFFDYQVPVPGIKYPAGLDAKSDLKLLLQIATCSHLKQGQDKKNLNKQIFYCKNSGKGCFKIQVLFNEENEFEILDDYTIMQHSQECRERLRLNSKIIQIYNLMMLKRLEIEKFMVKQGLFDCSPEVILQKISGDTGDYFYCKAVSDMENKRKLKKRFDNIINITIKKKRDRKLEEQSERRKEDQYIQQQAQPQDAKVKKELLISSFQVLSLGEQQNNVKEKKSKKKKSVFPAKENTIKPKCFQSENVRNLVEKKKHTKESHKAEKRTNNHRKPLQNLFANTNICKNEENERIVSRHSLRYQNNQEQDSETKQQQNQSEIYEQNDEEIIFEEQVDDYFQRNSNRNLYINERKQEIWAGSNQSIGDQIGFGDQKIRLADMCCPSLPNNNFNRSLQKQSLLEINNQVEECDQENQYFKPSIYSKYNFHQLTGKENAKN